MSRLPDRVVLIIHKRPISLTIAPCREVLPLTEQVAGVQVSKLTTPPLLALAFKVRLAIWTRRGRGIERDGLPRQNRDGNRPADVRAVAKLAVVVVTPALHPAHRGQRTGV